jgi:hypothetical protein
LQVGAWQEEVMACKLPDLLLARQTFFLCFAFGLGKDCVLFCQEFVHLDFHRVELFRKQQLWHFYLCTLRGFILLLTCNFELVLIRLYKKPGDCEELCMDVNRVIVAGEVIDLGKIAS